jgi:3-oxoacyl-[acyl-carrier protein] reductase
MARIILITGTRKGIGRSLAEHYLALGDTVIGCSRQASDLAHANYTHHTLDITDEKAVISMVRATKKAHGRIDVLINNAGIASMNHCLTTSLSSLQNVLSTNVTGTFLFTREVAKAMKKQEGGRIVNFSTVAAPLHLEGEAIYAASKAAVENLTKTLAKELAPFGITINAIGPTPIPTDLIKTVPKEKMDDLVQKQAVKRLGTLEDVRHVIDFLIDKKSDFITAQVLYLGGITN